MITHRNCIRFYSKPCLQMITQFQQMNAFEKLLDSCHDSYVNYHRLHETNLLNCVMCMLASIIRQRLYHVAIQISIPLRPQPDQVHVCGRATTVQ